MKVPYPPESAPDELHLAHRNALFAQEDAKRAEHELRVARKKLKEALHRYELLLLEHGGQMKLFEEAE